MVVVIAVAVGAVVLVVVVVVIVLLDAAHECLGSARGCVCPWQSAVRSIVGMRGWKSRRRSLAEGAG